MSLPAPPAVASVTRANVAKTKPVGADSSALTNRFLNRSRALLDVADHPACVAASLASLEQAVCAWIAEVLEVSPVRRQSWLLHATVADVLAQLEDEAAAELEELRQLYHRPDAFLFQLKNARLQDVQPPATPSPERGGLSMVTAVDSVSLEQIHGWQNELEALIERGRETAVEC